MNYKLCSLIALIVLALVATGCGNGKSKEATSATVEAVSAQRADEAVTPPKPSTPEPMPSHSNQGSQAALAKKDENKLAPPPPPAGSPPPQPHNAAAAAGLAVQPHAPHGMMEAAMQPHQPPVLHGIQVTVATQYQKQHYQALAAHFIAPGMLHYQFSPDKQPHTEMLKMGDVAISNIDPTDGVNFAIKSGFEGWQDEFLKPQDSKEYPCGNMDNECLFWMQTGSNTPVYYKINSSKRYLIVWNADKQLWDLKLAQLDN